MPHQFQLPPKVPGAEYGPSKGAIQKGLTPYPFYKGLPGYIKPSPYIKTSAFRLPYYQQTRESYLDLLNQLQQQAAGEGPTQAQGLLQQATDRNIAQLMGVLGSQSGLQPGGALARSASQQAAEQRQEASREASLLRAQEMVQAREALLDTLTQLTGLDRTQLEANIKLQEMISERVMGGEREKTQRQGGLFGFLGGLFSDEKKKKEIVENEEDIQAFLDTLGGYYGL